MSALLLHKIGKTYAGRRALVDVSVELASGQVSAVVGPNGAGKSTLLGILSTLVAPTTGELRWGDETLHRSSPARARHRLRRPRARSLRRPHAPRQNLIAVRRAVRPGAARRARGGDAGAGWPGRSVPAEAAVRTFSRGMQQRLALARALLHEPAILLFDEPGSALDPAGAAWLGRELAHRARRRPHRGAGHPRPGRGGRHRRPPDRAATRAGRLRRDRAPPASTPRPCAPSTRSAPVADAPAPAGDAPPARARWPRRPAPSSRHPPFWRRRCASRSRTCASSGAAARSSTPWRSWRWWWC